MFLKVNVDFKRGFMATKKSRSYPTTVQSALTTDRKSEFGTKLFAVL